VIAAFPDISAYTLDLPNSPDMFLTFHASILKWFHPNDPDLFPSHEHTQPGPIVTAKGVEEYTIKKIINECQHGHGLQYLVHWKGFGLSNDLWLPWQEVEDCEALDDWLAHMV